MCGIYGYIGNKNALDEVFLGLKLLQYRGYDSCGIAYYTNKFNIIKAVGTLENLLPNIEKIKKAPHIAFAHTRWATNGEVNLSNTHPHVSNNKQFSLVHNGIITNSDKIKKDLIEQGFKFYSETDSEVIVNLLESLSGEIEERISKMHDILEGSFALIIGCNNGDIYLTKRFNPLNIVVSDEGIYISSDLSSLNTGDYYTLKDGDIIKITENKIIPCCNTVIEYKEHVNCIKTLNLGEYNHYMQKEILETPTAIYNTYKYLKTINVTKPFKHIKKITFLGCGTAYHSCLIGENLLNLLGYETSSMLASNFKVNKKIKNNHLHIIVSQSGETADCIKVAEDIKKHNGKLLIITNEEKSSITRFADFLIVTQAGKELAVASTKTYCTQVFTFAYIYNILKNKNYSIDIDEFSSSIKKFISGLSMGKLATKLKDLDKLIIIAKDVDYLTVLEASLKIREIDYVYTIPMYSGELKHGTLSLIDKGTIVLSLNTSEDKDKIKNAINEISSRGGEVIQMETYITRKFDCYTPIFSIIPFQLLCYDIALLNDRNPDMPRNLAKSVTVE
ncbi:MAG TPA: glutamine--fructose-6-phosphate transaminase (isomerizing) [Candidatus Onthoplasma faecipullorum]|nr:glutamine--fructose-6-phosphate transaminase (isomerizing) [Candidatus Onthoplasma faecipullorum]